MTRCNKLIFFLLCFVVASTLFGQRLSSEKPKMCTNKPVTKGNYKILSIGLGVELQIDIVIKPKNRNDKNYIAIAQEFKEKYCQEEQLRITYYTSKKQWLILDPFDLASTPLAIFYTSTKKGEYVEKEKLILYKIVDGKVETRELAIETPKE